MSSNTDRRLLQYTQRKLPDNVFAIIRMTWFYDGVLESVEEVRLIDEGLETLSGFIDCMKSAIEAGADICIISPYSAAEIGLEEEDQ
jgi:hypothetical protein